MRKFKDNNIDSTLSVISKSITKDKGTSAIEPLECRKLLSAAVSVSGNVLSINGNPTDLTGYSNYAIGNDPSSSTDLAFLNKLSTTSVTPPGADPMHINLTRVWLGFQWADGVSPFKIDHYAWQSGEAHKAGQQPPSDLDHAVYDLMVLNDDYFTRLASFVKTASDDGIVVQLCLFDAVQFDTTAQSDWSRSPYNPHNNINDKSDPKNVYAGSAGSDDRLKFLSSGANSAMWTKVTQPLIAKVADTLQGYTNVIYEILNEPNAHGFQAYNTIKGVGGSSQTQTEVRDFHIAVTGELETDLNGAASPPVILVNVDSTEQLPLYNWAISNPSVSMLSIHTIYPNAETQSPRGLLGKHVEMSSDGDIVITNKHAAEPRLAQFLSNAFSNFPVGDRSIEVLDNSIYGSTHNSGSTTKPKYIPDITSINAGVLKQIVSAAPQPKIHHRSDDLGTPTGLIIDGATTSTVNLSWAYTGLSPDDFLIEEMAGGAWVTTGTASGSSSAFQVDGLLPGTAYQLRVTPQIDGMSGTASVSLATTTYAAVSASPTGSITTPVIAPLPTTKGKIVFIGSNSQVAGTPAGFLPNQVRTGYGENQISFDGMAGDGTGQTIAIIDWGDDPFMFDSTSSLFPSSDLHKFDVAAGLPDPPSFKKVDQNGGTNYPSSGQGTEVEISLDVEWAHAMAPGANILLVEASNNTDSNLFTQAINYARNQPGVSLISMSFGETEFGQETTLDQYLTTPSGHQGITFLASAGDSGNIQEYPSASPNVVSVGGTSLYLNSGNAYKSESAWSGSGGGISLVETKPSYQESYAPLYNVTNRATPDVAFLADPNTGVAIIDTADYGGWSPAPIGGTSLASPLLAGVLAVANQGRSLAGKGSLNGVSDTLPDLYTLSQSKPADFHDIITGNDGYPAKPGYDFVTGLGTPVANLLVPDLIGDRSPVISSLTAQPGSETAGTTFTLSANGVSDPDGGGVTVSFYRESNGLAGLQTSGQTDTLIGTSSSGFTDQVSTAGMSAGNYTYYAVVTDKIGLFSQTATTTNTVTVFEPPTIASLSSNPPTEVVGSPFSLVAVGVSDSGGTIANVAFYRESNGIAGLQTTGVNPDTSLGASTGSQYSDTIQTSSVAPGSYKYYAIATDTQGASSNTVSTTNAVTQLPPVPPTNLRVTSVGASSVNLAWDPSSTFGVIYRVAYSTDGTSFTHLDDAPGTTYTALGLSAGTTYYFEVRAADSALTVFSNYTNVVSASPSIPVPAAPTNLQVTSTDASSINLSFTPSVSGGQTRIAISTDNLNFNNAGVTGGSTFTITGLTAGTLYYIKARDDNGSGVYSPYTPTVTGTTVNSIPAAPNNLQVTSSDDSSISLSFTPSTSGGQTRIAISTDNVNFNNAGVTSGSTFTISGLASGTLYYIKARDDNGTGVYSDYTPTVTASTTVPIPAAPTNLRVASSDSTSVTLAFTPSVSGGQTRIAMSTDGSNWNNAGETGGSSFAVTELLPGTTYYFEARDDSGSGVYSAYTPTVSATPTIAPPSNLVAARDEATPALDVLLTWTNNASNITGINIARSTDGVNFDHLTTLNAGTTSYLDASGLVKGREYYYEIRAYEVVNGQTYYSAYSNIDAAIPR